jgi:hypothetical protein
MPRGRIEPALVPPVVEMPRGRIEPALVPPVVDEGRRHRDTPRAEAIKRVVLRD